MLQFNQPISLSKLADLLQVKLYIPENYKYDPDISVSSVASVEQASAGQVAFIDNPWYVKYLETTDAAAVIIYEKYLTKCNTASLISDNPRLSFVRLLNLCINNSEPTGIHPNCVLGKDVIIGNNVTIEAGVVIGNNCSIGDNTVIKANVVLYNNVVIGNNCFINSNTVIGSDGFGYVQDEYANWVKVPHLGGVIIKDHVEIGSNTSIDRGCMGNTLINKGVIIDNLVQIAHNVVIGEYTAIAGCVAIAGSTSIGNRCLIGGASSIAGHLVIADEVYITATSSVNKSLVSKGVYSSGLPVKDNPTWRKNIARFNLLDRTLKDILDRVGCLEKK